MASISSPGIGSGINVNSLVSQLVAAERAPGDRRFARAEASMRADISSFGTVSSALSSFQTALNTLRGSVANPARSVVVPEGAGFTATATPRASLGQFSVKVEQLAQAQVLQSAPQVAQSTYAAGTLDFSVGSTNFSVAVAQGDTLATVRDAINRAGADKGVGATIVRSDAGETLVLTATRTGTGATVSVAASAGLSMFASGGSGGFSETQAAQDARVRVNGLVRTNGSNQIADAIDGVTLSLTKALPDRDPDTVSVNADNAPVRSAVQSFVNTYNAALKSLRDVSAVNAETNAGSPLTGDPTIRSITQQLRVAVGNAFSELSSLGITGSKDGSLTLDAAKLDSALRSDAQAVSRVFASDRGANLGEALSGRLRDALDANGGLIPGRTKALDDRLKSLDRDRLSFERRIEGIEGRYRKQFTALDGLVSRLQSTSSFLAQELGRLSNASSR